MNIYEVEYKRYKDTYVLKVAADTPIRAIEDAQRWCKRKYYDTVEVIGVAFLHKVDVFYKTKKKRK